jgi:lipopolysaccharide/colanic/teichoic acid biosynthesis glycosyltransferase
MNQEAPYPIKQLSLSYRVVRRSLDIVLGGLLLLISFPIILVAAIAIRLETEGNPFFVQRRIGLGGKPFYIVKLRGMFIDARVRFAGMYDYGRHAGLNRQFHPQEDPRITRVGAFIRRTSIDELPNFLNVMLGQMTLVGPRPEIPEMIDLYGEYTAAYLSIKPGVTCISKISGRDHLSKRDSIELDLTYLDKMSMTSDLIILLSTLVGVILRRGVYDGKLPSEVVIHGSRFTRQNKSSSPAGKPSEAGAHD